MENIRTCHKQSIHQSIICKIFIGDIFTYICMCKVFYSVKRIPFCESQFIKFENHCTGGYNVLNLSKRWVSQLARK